MSLYITGFIVALVLALLVIAWIAYCMFVRERHKSELYHHNIDDIQRRNNIMQIDVNNDTKSEKKEFAVGMFVLPSRHKQKDEELTRRPDYPESSLRFKQSTDKLIDILDDDACYKDGIYEVDSAPSCQTHSDV